MAAPVRKYAKRNEESRKEEKKYAKLSAVYAYSTANRVRVEVSTANFSFPEQKAVEGLNSSLAVPALNF